MVRLMPGCKEIGQAATARYSGLSGKHNQSSEIAEQLETLQSMDLIALRDEWRKLKCSEPPRLSRDLMQRAIAYALQVRTFGEMPADTIKKLEAPIGEVGAVLPPAELTRRDLCAGARLVREWHGRTHSVEVLKEGFLFEGKVYRSLSEIARFITGSHWSGPRFFGLTGKRR